MRELEKFWSSVKKEEAGILATSSNGHVTMRVVSPVYYEDAILIFTSPDSLKYQQIEDNPNCCIAIGDCFLEAKAQFLGSTMKEENAAYRDVYSAKFNDAFSEGTAFGGRDAEFVLLKPIRLKGWTIENGTPIGPFEHTY